MRHRWCMPILASKQNYRPEVHPIKYSTQSEFCVFRAFCTESSSLYYRSTLCPSFFLFVKRSLLNANRKQRAPDRISLSENSEFKLRTDLSRSRFNGFQRLESAPASDVLRYTKFAFNVFFS